MGRAFEYRKATKLKRWGHMARTFTKLGKEIAIAVKAGGPEPENNPRLRALIATCKRENMPKRQHPTRHQERDGQGSERLQGGAV